MPLDTKTLIRDLATVNAEASSLCEGLSVEQLAWRPQPGIWSISGNLIHLCITTEVFIPVVDEAMSESRRRELLDSGPFCLGLYGRLLVRYVEPPPLIRLPAPRTLRPPLSRSPDEPLHNFLVWQSKMMLRMEGAKGINLTATRFASPLASFIKMNLLEFFSVFNGHSRRHLWQIKNLRREIPS